MCGEVVCVAASPREGGRERAGWKERERERGGKVRDSCNLRTANIRETSSPAHAEPDKVFIPVTEVPASTSDRGSGYNESSGGKARVK